ncbi:MAG: hypothetical protein QGG53_19205 [Planctomycetota bacterium]|jgi:hypothetical protein|nr:hypothetical protein [Planctomycetota bacterium]
MLKPFSRVGSDMMLVVFARVLAACMLATTEQEPAWLQFHGPDQHNVSSGRLYSRHAEFLYACDVRERD